MELPDQFCFEGIYLVRVRRHSCLGNPSLTLGRNQCNVILLLLRAELLHLAHTAASISRAASSRAAQCIDQPLFAKLFSSSWNDS